MRCGPAAPPLDAQLPTQGLSCWERGLSRFWGWGQCQVLHGDHPLLLSQLKVRDAFCSLAGLSSEPSAQALSPSCAVVCGGRGGSRDSFPLAWHRLSPRGCSCGKKDLPPP